MKRIGLAVFGAVALVGLMVLPASGVSTTPKATGSVIMAEPLQAAEFNAFQSVPVKGSISYTNFELPAPDTGMFVPNVGTPLTLSITNVYFGGVLVYSGPPLTHTITFDSFTPTSSTRVTFEGHGFYDPDPTWTESISGSIEGDHIEFSIVPDDGGLKYVWTLASFVGDIAGDGSMLGTATDNYTDGVTFGRTYDWSLGAGAHSVFSYTADVTCATVGGSAATFGFTIPIAPLAGVPVSVNVTDGGSPGALYDTWAHGVGACGAATSPYLITAGNLTVH